MHDLTASSSCLSDLALDEWLAGELDPQQRAQVEAHLSACARCRRRHSAFADEYRTFLDGAPSFADHAAFARGARPVRARVPRKLGWAALGLAAAAAAAALLVLPAVPDAVTRSKGGPHIGFFVKRRERISTGRAGQSVQPGDLLRFTYSSDRARYLALINLDERGASVYYPQGDRAARVAPGSRVALDFSIELDETLGRERIHAVFCPEPFEVEPVRARLEAGATFRAPPGCHLDVIDLTKEPRR